MEKRFFLAFIIIIAFFMFWSRFMPGQSVQPIVPQEDTKDISNQNLTERAEEIPAIREVFGSSSEEFPTANVGNFIITYSPTGGYIREISLSPQADPLPFKNIGFTPTEKGKRFKVSVGDNKIVFKDKEGYKKEFIFQEYKLLIRLSSKQATPLLIFSNYLSSKGLTQRYQESFYSQNNTLKRSNASRMKEGVYNKIAFAGARDQYTCLSLVKGEYNLEWVKDKYSSMEDQRKVEKTRVDLFLLSPLSELVLYIGPQSAKELKLVGLEEILRYGFFHVIGVGMVKLLVFFHLITKSWGLSIILLTLCLYGISFPFTAKSTKALKKMQQVQPEIEALRQKYKDSPQKVQKETIELYKKYKVNPLGGCLPLLLQLPIFLTLWQVLPRFAELRGAGFLWIKDLSEPDRLFSLPFTLPIFGNNFNLLPILLMVVSLLQQKLTTSSAVNSQQKSMGLFMAIFFGVIFYNLPAALVLYWFIQSSLTFLYQLRINKAQ